MMLCESRLPSQYYDAETNLHYNWNRYYDPVLGRYITSDPIGLRGGMNTYGYANANSLMYYDPYGLLEFSSGVSFNGTVIVGDSGSDGVSGGTNAQFFSDGSSGLFGVAGTGSGADIGVDVQFNGAVYTGDGSGGVSSWEGKFNNLNVNFGPVSISFFWGGGWYGVSGGGGVGLPLGVSHTETNYVPIPGTLTPPGTMPGTGGNGALPGWGNVGPVNPNDYRNFCLQNPGAPNCQNDCY